jgi:hypothetical protein
MISTFLMRFAQKIRENLCARNREQEFTYLNGRDVFRRREKNRKPSRESATRLKNSYCGALTIGRIANARIHEPSL